MSLVEEFRQLMQTVRVTPEGQAALRRNAQNQQVAFAPAGGEGFTLHLTAQSDELAVTPGIPVYRRFHTTIFETDAAVLGDLIAGKLFFSEPYLSGDLTVKGSVTIKQLMARLFRIGKELRERQR